MKKISYKRTNMADSSNNSNNAGYIYALAFITEWCCAISQK